MIFIHFSYPILFFRYIQITKSFVPFFFFFLVINLCLTLGHMDCSPPGFSVHENSQANILECIAIPFSRESSRPRDQTHVSCIASEFFTTETPMKSFVPRKRTIKMKPLCYGKQNVVPNKHTLEHIGKESSKRVPDQM